MLRVVNDGWDEVRLIQQHITAKASGGRALKILEAGCGREWTLPLPGIDFHLTGVDLDEDALQARLTHSRDLHEARVGDLRTVTFPPESFDVIFCSYVLEHIQGARIVLDNFRSWLKPGGLIVVRVPDPNSVFGFVSHHTPYRLHVALYRYLYGARNAGKPGFGPYPTYYDEVISVCGMNSYCRTNDLMLRAVVGHYLFSAELRQRFLAILTHIAGALTLGRLAGDHNNLTFIIEKGPATC